MTSRKIHIDFETRSDADLEEVGAWAYSKHPSTKVLCVAVAIDNEEPKVFDLFNDSSMPFTFNHDDQILATNVSFEYCIWKHVLTAWAFPNLDQWRDVQAKLCANAFPAKLENGAKALGLSQQKDVNGTALINYFCKPVSNGGSKGTFREPKDNAERYAELLKYCAQDVRTQQAIDLELPDLTESELEYWRCTFRTNLRGLCIDRDLAASLIRMADLGKHDLDVEIINVTKGALRAEDFTNNAKITEWIRSNGLFIDGVSKLAITNALKLDNLSDQMRFVLRAKQLLSKSSLAKLPNMLAESAEDGRIRFNIRYHGAVTGRDTSMGVQIQNLPRGEKGMDVDALIASAVDKDYPAFKKAANGSVLGAIASCLRGCFVAGSGSIFTQCDYAAIEPRLAAWFFNETSMLQAFRDFDRGLGPDIYQLFAARFYNEKDPLKIKGDRRTFGKVAELQLLYQSGADKFRTTAKDTYGVVISEDEAIRAVAEYRCSHAKIRRGWSDIQEAAHMACNKPGVVYIAGKVAFRHDKKHLYMKLPCGRKICYPFAYVAMKETSFGKAPTLVCLAWVEGHWTTVHHYGGSLTNNIIQGLGGSLLRHAVIQLDKKGYKVSMRVHDELVAEVPSTAIDPLKDFKKTMLSLPKWAENIPVNGEGWVGPRYKKG